MESSDDELIASWTLVGENWSLLDLSGSVAATGDVESVL
jgi:hypothetical protein